MCGRMTLTRSAEEIAEAFALARPVPSPDGSPREGAGLRPRYNLAPSQDVLTVDGAREPAWRRWGLVPAWAKDPSLGARLFNARAETVAEKPSFRAAFRKRRCLVVADGFYEWSPRSRGHRPFHFAATRGGLLGLAGLYETWLGPGGECIESCTVITTAANADLEDVHPRMPAILSSDDQAVWLAEDVDRERLASLLGPAPAGTLTRQEVGRLVNSPRHDDPRCLEPAAAEEGPGPLFEAGEGTA